MLEVPARRRELVVELLQEAYPVHRKVLEVPDTRAVVAAVRTSDLVAVRTVAADNLAVHRKVLAVLGVQNPAQDC